MIRPNQLILLILAVSATFAACQKGLEEPAIVPVKCLISKITFTAPGDTISTTLEYDNQQRIIHESFFEHGDKMLYHASVVYETGKFAVVDGEVTGGPDPTDTTVYTMENGKVISAAFTRIRTEGGYTETTKNNFVYERNTEGYLTKLTETDNFSSTYPGSFPSARIITNDYTYKDGNVISKTYTSSSVSYTERYEYYLDKPAELAAVNKDSWELANEPHEANLIKKMTIEAGGTITETDEYSYTYDTDGKIIKMKTLRNDGFEENDTYEYKCQ